MKLIICNFSFGDVFRPNVDPGPAPTAQARNMVQNAPNISSADHFDGRFVTIFWSQPKLKFKMCTSSIVKAWFRMPMGRRTQ